MTLYRALASHGEAFEAAECTFKYEGERIPEQTEAGYDTALCRPAQRNTSTPSLWHESSVVKIGIEYFTKYRTSLGEQSVAVGRDMVGAKHKEGDRERRSDSRQLSAGERAAEVNVDSTKKNVGMLARRSASDVQTDSYDQREVSVASTVYALNTCT